ncbi:MAG: thioesterase family protein [Pseudomonadota bacterium]|nr:thioesterase family protein [Pseudomonadota bacterium]
MYPNDDNQREGAVPASLLKPWQKNDSHIDHYQHVNNVAYLSQLESLAWSHSNHLGLTFDDYRACGKGMVIHRHELDYLLPCHEGDTLLCATWIVECDGKLNLERRFQFICPVRRKTVFAARTRFVCVNLKTGAPARMPALFKNTYTEAVTTS